MRSPNGRVFLRSLLLLFYYYRGMSSSSSLFVFFFFFITTEGLFITTEGLPMPLHDNRGMSYLRERLTATLFLATKITTGVPR